MKKISFISVLAFAIVSLASCQKENFTLETPEHNYAHVLTASMLDTKTSLGADNSVLWSEGDAFNLINVANSAMAKYEILDGESGKSSAQFGSDTDLEGSTFVAVYPYNAENGYVFGSLMMKIPAKQTYAAGSFGVGANPAVAYGTDKNNLYFKNLFGVLQLILKGNGDQIVRIEVIADKQISGQMSVSNLNSEAPTIATASTNAADKQVVLDCGFGVALTPDGVPFNIVLPAGEYKNLVIKLYNNNARVDEKVKDVTISRSHIKPVSYTPVFNPYYYGTSNCVLVAPSATTVEIPAAAALTDDALIFTPKALASTSSAVAAKIVWQDVQDFITNLAFDGSKITMNKKAQAGNALIALVNGAGDVLWNFHVWASDPQDHLYTNLPYTADGNKQYKVMDRNLGAINATPNDKGALGLYYRWGSSIPYMGAAAVDSNVQADMWDGNGNKVNTAILQSGELGIAQSYIYNIANPLTYACHDALWGYYTLNVYGLWGTKMSDFDNMGIKSVYDPCPEGYMVVPTFTYHVLSTDVQGNTWNHGYELKYDGTNKSWFPAAGALGSPGIVNVGGEGYQQTSGIHSAGLGVALHFDYNATNGYENNGIWFFPNQAFAFSTRCRKISE